MNCKFPALQLNERVCGRVGRRPIKLRKAPVEGLGLFCVLSFYNPILLQPYLAK